MAKKTTDPAALEAAVWEEIVETLQSIEPVLLAWRDVRAAAPGTPELKRAIEAMDSAWVSLAACHDALREDYELPELSKDG